MTVMAMPDEQSRQAASRIMARSDTLALISQTPGQLTRVFLSPEHLRANQQVARWMEEAGMTTWQDATGNICGRYEGATEGASAVLLGSHLDTVRNAGRYDGMLGVLTAIEVVDWLNRQGKRLNQAIEVIGFSDEEGTRFGITLLGSRGITGTWPENWLECQDNEGITVAQAMVQAGLDPARIGMAARNQEDFTAYLELHIEQGPVLEQADFPLGVVTAINGAHRLRCCFTGQAGHAGTVPMAHRHDALAAAAAWIHRVEQITLASGGDNVATVGTVNCLPGAVNVIPGSVELTLDIRSPSDDSRDALLSQLLAQAENIASQRGLSFTHDTFYSIPATPCSPILQAALSEAVASAQGKALSLPSGAGHDAIAVAERWPVGMLFVRCEKGISHHPAESITEADVAVAMKAWSQAVCAVAEAPTPLVRFNQADSQAATAMIQACVAIPAWQDALVAGRPYSSFTALKKHAVALAATWQTAELNQALSAHPRIGERPTGKSEEAQLSRGEQAAVNTADQELAQALAKGNADYEARFGRVFLIRAKGLSGHDILQALQRRMKSNPEQETQEALEQLRQITLLRLEGVFLP